MSNFNYDLPVKRKWQIRALLTPMFALALLLASIGLRAQCSPDVTPPTITCPESVTFNNTTGQCDAVVNFATPTASDNCTGSNISQTFSYTGTIQTFTVPAGVTSITIEAKGGQGGNSNSQGKVGGLGAVTTGTYNVTPGSSLQILAGGSGEDGQGTSGFWASAGGGGGGSFVAIGADAASFATPLIAAGGGGGGFSGRLGNDLTNIPTDGGHGGVLMGGSGNGGLVPTSSSGQYYGGGGAGVLTDGVTGVTCSPNNNGGKSIISGGAGGNKGTCLGNINNISGKGGFGGGAGANWTGGGGGGYSGGDASAYGTPISSSGGTSYIHPSASSSSNVAGMNAGNGQVIISWNAPNPTVAQTGGLPSGSSFPVGTTTNTFLATDATGNTATCSQTITVVDNEAPMATCAADVTIDNSPGLCTGTTILLAPTVTDNCIVSANALNFDGTDDFVTSPAVGLITTDKTFTAWVKLNSLTQSGGGLVSIETNTGEVFDAIVYNETNQGWGFGSDFFNRTSWSGIQETSTEEWVHLAATYSNNDYRLYRNGVLILQTTSFGVTAFPETSRILVGKRHTEGYSAYLNALIDEVGVWNSALTQSQIQTIMTTGVLSQSGLTLAYNFNQGIAAGNNTAVPGPAMDSAHDGSGFNRNGAVSNFALSGPSSNWVGGHLNNNAPLTFPKGNTTVTWTLIDNSGNSTNCSQIVTVRDAEKPTALCKNISLNLSNSGTVSTNAAAVNNNSSDNCGIISLTLSKSTFNCSNFGTNTVVLTVTDNSSNSASCTAIITIGYTQPPVAKCKNAIVVLSSAGNGSISAAGINNASTDLCSANGLTLALSKTTFNCSNIGANVVTLTVTNVAGLSSSCTGTVTVKDLTKPVAKCKPASATVAPGGTVTVLPGAVNNVSTDACTSPPNLSLAPSTFTCANAGPNTVILTVSDASNNISTCSAIVTITCSGGVAPEKAIGTQAFADYIELMDLFPNPAADKVNIRLSNAVHTATPVTILDNTGRTLYSGWIGEGSNQLQVDLTQSKLNSGIYLVSVKLADRVQTKSLVIFRD